MQLPDGYPLGFACAFDTWNYNVDKKQPLLF